ncbi:MAG: DNA polymerase I [Treponema sp.]|nr:DNA polymerase I [Treponema sp.]
MADFDKNTVYVLDSYGLIFRCYFAFISRPLTNPNGQNVSALFGFFRNFHYILEHYKPGYIVAAMDSKTKTFRHEMYEQYKATRNKTPDDLHAQIPWIEDVLSALGIPVLQCDGYEADDIIATVAKKCAASGRTCRILSGDKDLMQLVDDTTQILKPNAGTAWKVTGADGVEVEWGVKPAQLLDLLSLYGDTADNIPGVAGVGVKTAAKLLNEYGDLDGIYSHIDDIKGAMQKKLLDGKENAYFSQKLVRLCDSVPCSDIDAAIFRDEYTFDYAAAAQKLLAYGVPAVSKTYAALAVENGQKVDLNGLGEGRIDDRSFGNKTANTAGTSGHEDSAGGLCYPLSSGTAGSLSTDPSSNPSAATLQSRNALNATGSSVGTSLVQNSATVITPVKNVGNYKALLSAAELKSYIDGFLAQINSSAENSYLIAFDCETNSLDTLSARMLGFSLCYKKGEAVYVPLESENGDLFNQNDYTSRQDAIRELSRLFTNPQVTIAFHNGKFDYKVLRSNGCDCEFNCKLFDTMIAAWLLNPERNGRNGYSLEYLGETVLGLKGIEFSEIVAKGQTFEDVPLEKAVPYAAEDADFTYQLALIYRRNLETSGLSELYYKTEIEILPILAQMELTGIHLDSKKLNEYDSELTQGIHSAEQEIYQIVGHEFNIASPLQLQKVLFEERHLKPGKKTQRGYSTDTSVLEELALVDTVPKKILEFREMAKLQSTYVQTLPKLTDKNGRIHTDFVQTGTATGRLSCREPNLQNIPVRNEAGRRIRSAFTAPEGKVLISADYSQIELVVLSHLSGDENMCRAFREGTDVHKATAALIYGVQPEQVTPEMRRTAKTINFGVIYGMSAFRLANDLGISRTQAAIFIDNYFKMYSSVNQFIQNTIQSAEEKGFVTTIFGRKRPIMNINSRNKVEKSAAERIAVNTPVQGSAADIVKKAMLDVTAALKESGSKAKLLLQVHDELIFECPDDEETVQKTIALIKDKMEHAVELSVPLKVSIEYGKNWGEFH